MQSTPKWRKPSPFNDARGTGLDPEIFDAIGRLITSWKTVETFAIMGTSYLLKADYDRTLIAMAGMQARTMLTTLRSLVHHVDPARKVEFDRIYARLETALAYRNEAAHAPIVGFVPADAMVVVNNKVRIQKRGVVLQTTSPITAHKIHRRALYTKIAAGTLIAFIEPYKPPLVLKPLASAPSPQSPRPGHGALA